MAGGWTSSPDHHATDDGSPSRGRPVLHALLRRRLRSGPVRQTADRRFHHRGGPCLNARASQLHDIAVETYTFLYPLITMDATRRQMTNAAPGQLPGRGPTGQFAHVRAFPTADMRVVVRP